MLRPFIDEEFYCRVNQKLDTLTQIKAAQQKTLRWGRTEVRRMGRVPSARKPTDACIYRRCATHSAYGESKSNVALPTEMTADTRPSSRREGSCLFIEDSRTLSSILRPASKGTWPLCHTLRNDRGFPHRRRRRGPAIRRCGVDLNLPDSPDGQILDKWFQHDIPAVVLTPTSIAICASGWSHVGVAD